MSQHITMFKYHAKKGYIRCTISDEFKGDFEKIGFVDHIDKVKSPARKKKAVKDAN